MYAIEITPEFSKQAEALHPKRYKQVHLKVFALLLNPRPPDCTLLDAERCLVRVGPYTIAYKIDDSQQRVQVIALEEQAQ
ncbi:MAG: type II toxin-antitoxin system RelE/ParE family toxin [Chloroflexi bacterium]|nr:type II toxin-antitoxin system RelE/ParE family toxin [Chloroflexota bacterium]